MNIPASSPVSIFISYSHKDYKYLDKLYEALAPLRKRKLIDQWYDGKIIPGNEFGPEIIRQLNKAEIIILLLSPSYVSSDYCWDIEMEEAIQLRKRNNVRVVGIQVREVPIDGLELSKHKLLPKDRKPIPEWHPQDAGWANVCLGIEQVINDLKNPSQIDDALEVPKTIVEKATEVQSRLKIKRATKVYELNSVSEFWEKRSSCVKTNNIIKLQGTFSKFAPMLMGEPKAKARLHKVFRQALENSKALIKKKGNTLDACLSVSAGQMVCRLKNDKSSFVYCGLYNSIVRNSIPVLVSRKYYETSLLALFKKYGGNALEAEVKGRVIEIDNAPAKEFLNKHAKSFIPQDIANDLCNNVYGLLIDGESTAVAELGSARYLDGDIWIAVESGGNERFLTSFLNVADPRECKQELDVLLAIAQKLPDSPRIISQYDQDRNFDAADTPLSENNRFFDSIWRFGFGS